MKRITACGLILAGLLGVLSCVPAPDAGLARSANCRYLRDTLGAIVLGYQARHGEFPATVSEALADTPGVSLPQRGDWYGRATVYTRTTDGFSFTSAGADGRLNTSDDEGVVYQTDRWLMACPDD